MRDCRVSGVRRRFLLIGILSILPAQAPLGQSQAADATTVLVPPERIMARGAIRAYQLLISGARGTSCPMHPHCSQYAMQAFQRYGPLTALMKTTDRLQRCGHDLHRYPKIQVVDYVRFSDPPGELPPPSSTGTTDSVTDSVFSAPIEESNTTVPVSDELGTLLFARRLLDQRCYLLAIMEFRRFLFFHSQSDSVESAYRGLYDSYRRMGDYAGAVDAAQEAVASLADSVNRYPRHYRLGMAYYYRKDYAEAEAQWRISSQASRTIEAQKSPCLIGLAMAHQTRWEEAAAQFSQVGPENPYARYADDCRRLAEEGMKLPRKDPMLAGILSTVPGGGYLYSGHPRTAVSALVINSLLAWGTIRAFDSENTGLGILLGTLTFSWYTGNVYGGMETARRRNRKDRQDLLLQFDIGFSF